MRLVRQTLLITLMISLPWSISAAEKYKCRGEFNTSSGYYHIYEVDSTLGIKHLSWNGAGFDLQENPNWLYAEYVGKTRTDAIYIDKQNLDVKFYSILPGLMLQANGKCDLS